MSKIPLAIALAALSVLIAASIQLGRLDRAGPAHIELVLDGEHPATLYLPAGIGAPDPGAPPEPDERPPVLLLIHGFTSDRDGVSGIARSLAVAGYAVLAIDLPGHGENENPFTVSTGRYDFMLEPIREALHHLRSSPYVDGSRLVLLGHSMGAGVALIAGTHDSGIDGVVSIAGSGRRTGPYRLPNALFLYAEDDGGRIKQASRRHAAQLSGVDRVESLRTYGDFELSTAVRMVEVRGESHFSILTSDVAVEEIVAWLDQIFGRERAKPARFDDPRRQALGIVFLAFLVLLPGIGELAGRLAPPRAELSPGGALPAVGWLALALVIALAFASAVEPYAFLSLLAGDMLVAQLSLAGLALLCGYRLTGHIARGELWRDLGGSVGPGVLAFAATALALAPVGIVVHNLVPTPGRLLIASAAFVLVLPYPLALNVLGRRGSVLRSTLVCSLLRVFYIATLVVGAALGFTGRNVFLLIPLFLFLSFVFELLAASIYTHSRNPLVAAVAEAAILAWILSVWLPVV